MARKSVFNIEKAMAKVQAKELWIEKKMEAIKKAKYKFNELKVKFEQFLAAGPKKPNKYEDIIQRQTRYEADCIVKKYNIEVKLSRIITKQLDINRAIRELNDLIHKIRECEGYSEWGKEQTEIELVEMPQNLHAEAQICSQHMNTHENTENQNMRHLGIDFVDDSSLLPLYSKDIRDFDGYRESDANFKECFDNDCGNEYSVKFYFSKDGKYVFHIIKEKIKFRTKDYLDGNDNIIGKGLVGYWSSYFDNIPWTITVDYNPELLKRLKEEGMLSKSKDKSDGDMFSKDGNIDLRSAYKKYGQEAIGAIEITTEAKASIVGTDNTQRELEVELQLPEEYQETDSADHVDKGLTIEELAQYI